MSMHTNEHLTRVVPHDVANCHTARHADGHDCGTRYMLHCSCGFGQGAICLEQADVIAAGHLVDPGAPVIDWSPPAGFDLKDVLSKSGTP